MAKAATKAKPKAPEPKSHIEIFECEQGSEDWYAAKLGIVSASNFHKVLAEGDGKVRTRYMRELAGELLTGKPAETFSNSAMDRGKVVEPEAAEEYAKRNFGALRRVGFVKNSGLMKYSVAGASPDYLVDDDGGLEIKSMIPALMIERFDKGATMPPEHKWQVLGNMWVCERKWWDIKIYYPKMPGYPGMPDYTVRVERNEADILKLSNAVEIFNHELKKLFESMRARHRAG